MAFISGLFDPEEVIWTGDIYDTGESHHNKHFRTTQKTLTTIDSGFIQPQRISPSTFKPNSYSRTKENIHQLKYLLIEADDFSTDPQENMKWNAGLIAFCRVDLEMTLRAVIMTGSKSLHAWFDPLPPDHMVELNTLAEGFGIDTATLNNPAAPLRLPHCKHEKTSNRAQLLFLQPQKLEHLYR